MAKKDKDSALDTAKLVAKTAKRAGKNAAEKATKAVRKANDSIISAIDENGNGEIDIEDIIIKGLHLPGVWVKRDDFLHKEFFKNHTEKQISQAISSTPAQAGIELDEIDEIAESVIQYERNCVSGISALLGAPGAGAMPITIPADVIQYYGYMLRAMQKLMYLYGFPQIKIDVDEARIDSEIINELTLCLGVMYGVAGANHALIAMANAFAAGVEKKLVNASLTKGVLFPIVKKIMKWFDVRLTKDMFAGFFKKAIPVVGGAVGGGITYATFKPCCSRLKAVLRETELANPTADDGDCVELNVIDVESELVE